MVIPVWNGSHRSCRGPLTHHLYVGALGAYIDNTHTRSVYQLLQHIFEATGLQFHQFHISQAFEIDVYHGWNIRILTRLFGHATYGFTGYKARLEHSDDSVVSFQRDIDMVVTIDIQSGMHYVCTVQC